MTLANPAAMVPRLHGMMAYSKRMGKAEENI
jgi:hypothetical protein